MKVLITGGLGYLGGRIAQHLGGLLPKSNIRLLIRNGGQPVPAWAEGYDVLSGNILDDAALSRACTGIDSIVHLAALNEIDSERRPLDALKVNGEGTLRLLNAATESGVGRFIYFSTFHVYGLNAFGEITENTVPAPFHPYAITHHVAEDFVRMATQKRKTRGVILRLSNGVGYPSHPTVNRWSLAFNNFCLQAVLRSEIVLKSSGRQHRDFITLTDISRCVEHILLGDGKIFEDRNIIYNLGGDYSISILDAAKLVAERCQKTLGKRSKIIVGRSSEEAKGKDMDEPVVYRCDRIKSTGFQLISNIIEEIDKTIAFCEENKEYLECNMK